MYIASFSFLEGILAILQSHNWNNQQWHKWRVVNRWWGPKIAPTADWTSEWTTNVAWAIVCMGAYWCHGCTNGVLILDFFPSHPGHPTSLPTHPPIAPIPSLCCPDKENGKNVIKFSHC